MNKNRTFSIPPVDKEYAPIVNRALEHIHNRLDCKVARVEKVLLPVKSDWAPDLAILLKDKKDHEQLYWVVFRRYIHRAIVDHLALRRDSEKLPPILIVSEYINPALGQSLVEKNIQFADSHGNMFMIPWKGSIAVVLARHRGPVSPQKAQPGATLHFAGAKILYAILTQRQNNLTIRKLADGVDVSPSMVVTVLGSLQDQEKIAQRGRKIILLAGQELLEVWVLAYKTYLRPRLFLGKFHLPSATPQEFFKAMSKEAKNLKTEYAITGDFAGGYYTKYLYGGEPVCFINREALNPLCKKLRLMPTNEPFAVELLDFFSPWAISSKETERIQYATPLLTYAEMLHNGSPRTLDAARVLYEEEIRKLL